MGYEITIRDPMKNYVGPYDGPTFDELLWRVLFANLDSFAWLWVEGGIASYEDLDHYEHQELSIYTHDEIKKIAGEKVDLNKLNTTGCYIINTPLHYVPGCEYISPVNIFNEYIDGIFFMITMIGPDIWYRVLNEANGVWTDWYLQSFCTIHKSSNPPETFDDRDLWLRLPNGDRVEYTLFGYYNNKWIEIGRSRWLITEIYDPQHIQRNIFEYLEYRLRIKLGSISVNNPYMDYLYMSECYSKVVFKFIVNGYYYFFINPEDIKINSELSQSRFYVIRYDSKMKNPTQIEGLQTNIRQMVISRFNRFYLLDEHGEIYHSKDAITWDNLPLSYISYQELKDSYRHIDLKQYTHEEIPHIKDPQLSLSVIELLDSIIPGIVYLFSRSGDVLVETDDLIFRFWKQNGIPAEFLAKDMIQWHTYLFLIGYQENDSSTKTYYVSKDDGETWRSYEFPVGRQWTNFYIHDDMCIATTGKEPTENNPQTYWASWKENPEELNWIPCVTDIGGANVADNNWLPIMLGKNEEGGWKVEYVIHSGTEITRTIYDFLHKYQHTYLSNYSHFEIKWLKKELLNIFETIILEPPNIIDGSLTDMDKDNFGVIFQNPDGTLGFQGLKFVSYIEDFEDHIHDTSRHLTEEDRKKIKEFITWDRARSVLEEFRKKISEYTDEESSKIIFDAKYEELAKIVDEYLAHALDYTIHIKETQREYYDNKADKSHAHILDNKLKLDASDVSGVLNPLQLPKQCRRKMITVPSLEEMYKLPQGNDPNGIHNGYVIRILSMEEYNLEMPLNGRFFWVLDEYNPQNESSYIEFTVTNDDILVYWNEISDPPTTKEGYGIIDIPDYVEFGIERTLHDKLIFGYELLSMDYVESVIKHKKHVVGAIDFLNHYRVQEMPRCITCNAQIMGEWMQALAPFMYKLDLGQTPFLQNDKAKEVIADIQYSDRTKQYFIFSAITIGKTEFQTNVIRLDYQFNVINVSRFPFIFPNIAIFPLSSTLELWTTGIDGGKAFVHDISKKKILLELPGECVPHSRSAIIECNCNIERYRTFIYVDRYFRLGFLKIDLSGKYDFRIFTNTIWGGSVESEQDSRTYNRDCYSLHYDSERDIITIIIRNGSNKKVYQYYGMSEILHSFQHFDIVDAHLDQGNLSEWVHFNNAIPRKDIVDISENYEMCDYLGYWNHKYVSIVSGNFGNGPKISLSVSDSFEHPNPVLELWNVWGIYSKWLCHVDVFLYNNEIYVSCIKSAESPSETMGFKNYPMTCNIGGYDYFNMEFDNYNAGKYLYNGYAYEGYMKNLLHSATGITFYCVSHLTDHSKIKESQYSSHELNVSEMYGARFCNGYIFSFGTEGKLIRFSPDQFIEEKINERAITIMMDNPYTSLRKNPIQLMDNTTLPSEIGYLMFSNGYSLSIKDIENVYNEELSLTDREYNLHKAPFAITETVPIMNGNGYATLSWQITATGDDRVKSMIISFYVSFDSPDNYYKQNGFAESMHVELDYKNDYDDGHSYASLCYIENEKVHFNLFHLTNDGLIIIVIDPAVYIQQERNIYYTISSSRIMRTKNTIGVGGYLYSNLFCERISYVKRDLSTVVVSKRINENFYSDTVIKLPYILIASYKNYILGNMSMTSMLITENDGIRILKTAISSDDSPYFTEIIIQEKCKSYFIGTQPSLSIGKLPDEHGKLKDYALIASSNIIAIINLENTNDWKIVTYPTMKNIVATGSIMLKKSYIRDEYYGFLILIDEPKEKRNMEGIEDLSFVDDTVVVSTKKVKMHSFPYDVYYMPITTDAIRGLFHSNYAMLQKTANSVYQQVENVITDIEKII